MSDDERDGEGKSLQTEDGRSYPTEFRDRQQYANVCNMLERWGRLRITHDGAVIMDNAQSAMFAFLSWLSTPAQYRNGKPLTYKELRQCLDDPTVGMLFDLLGAMRTGHDSVDSWMGKYGPEIFG